MAASFAGGSFELAGSEEPSSAESTNVRDDDDDHAPGSAVARHFLSPDWAAVAQLLTEPSYVVLVLLRLGLPGAAADDHRPCPVPGRPPASPGPAPPPRAALAGCMELYCGDAMDWDVVLLENKILVQPVRDMPFALCFVPGSSTASAWLLKCQRAAILKFRSELPHQIVRLPGNQASLPTMVRCHAGIALQ
ncbi:hypothetical protein ACP70R_032292 [Stipagrostis hirtigluma subsp. patula]